MGEPLSPSPLGPQRKGKGGVGGTLGTTFGPGCAVSSDFVPTPLASYLFAAPRRRGGANLFFPCILYFATTAAVHGIRSRLVPLSFLFRFFPRILVDDQGAGALARWHSFVLILKKSNDVKVTSEGRDDAAKADS